MDDADQTKEEKTESMEICHMIALDYIPDISSDLTSIKEHEPVEDDEIETIDKEIESFQDDNSETVDWSDIGCWNLIFKTLGNVIFWLKKDLCELLITFFR